MGPSRCSPRYAMTQTTIQTESRLRAPLEKVERGSSAALIPPKVGVSLFDVLDARC